MANKKRGHSTPPPHKSKAQCSIVLFAKHGNEQSIVSTNKSK